MKYADAYGFQRRMILYENQKAQQRARTFEAQCHEQNGFDKPYDAFSVFHIHGFTHQQTAFETYAFACYQNETDAYRSNAQTADLDEQRNDCTPEHGEMIRRVDGDEPCNTDRAGGSEQCINGGDLRAVSNRYRKHQQCGSGEDHQRETCGNQAARRLPFDEIHLFDLAFTKYFTECFAEMITPPVRRAARSLRRPRQVKKGT